MKDVLERIKPAPDYMIRTATVVSSSGARLTVKIADADVDVGRLKHYNPVVGEVVVCLFFNGDGLVMGAIA